MTYVTQACLPSHVSHLPHLFGSRSTFVAAEKGAGEGQEQWLACMFQQRSGQAARHSLPSSCLWDVFASFVEPILRSPGSATCVGA